MATAEQMDALLEGLCADDFDMDYDPNEPEDEEIKEPIEVDVEYDDCAPSFVPAVPTPNTTFVGFVTGRNTFIPPPSSEAFAKARKIFDEDPVLAEVASSLNAGEPAYKRARVEEADSNRMPPPRSSGFATGGGKAPPTISSAAQAATANLFAKPTPPLVPLATPSPQPSHSFGSATAAGRPPPISPSAQAANLFTTPAPVQAGSGFATARGGVAPPISPAAASASRDIFQNINTPKSAGPSGFATAGGSAPPPISKAAERTDLSEEGGGFHEEPPTGTFSLGFQTGAGKIVAPPSSAAQARARSMFDDDALPAASVPASTPILHPPQPTNAVASGSGRIPTTKNRIGAIYLDEGLSRPSQSSPNAFATPRPAQQRQSATGSTFRTPLRTTTNTPTIQPVALTGSPAPRKFKPIEIGTPVLRRRVGLGMTPSSRFGKKTAGFTTPFKSSQDATPLPRTSVAAQYVVAAPIIKPVFDVTPPPHRQTYREAYLKPQYTTNTELMEYGIPPEIYWMDLGFAKAFRFIHEDESDLGPAEALAKLKADGCEYATLAWTINHWSMIVWKLAGVIQAQHNLFEGLWRWDEVVSQLLYRYEREFGRAERPIVRRIHEHDSSPSLPLVLCVSAIIRPPPEVKEEEDKEPVPSRPFLELTDGWYRISAQVDDCLTRAIDRGKISVGRKLAVTGAKLESSGEGVDPLESLDKTLLNIAGNSTSLARWDARLGRQNEPFVAGLSSLSVDGGVISLMDVVIDKLFPVAYTSGERGKGDAPWNEEEELLLQDQWTEKYAAESARLQGEMRKQLEHVEDVVSALCSAAEGVEDRMGDSPDSVDQIFETLLECQSVDSRLRTMASSTLLHVAAYGRSYFEREAANSFLEVEAELQVLCPVRQVRDFRMARIIDTRPGNKVACRTGMLTVWEAKALGEGGLIEGRRYMVSNVTPGRAGDWRPPVPTPDGIKKEIYLHTRKDTRWQPIE